MASKLKIWMYEIAFMDFMSGHMVLRLKETPLRGVFQAIVIF